MRIICSKCGAKYNIPVEKLKKEINRTTCRRCGNRMEIRKPSAKQPQPLEIPSILPPNTTFGPKVTPQRSFDDPLPTAPAEPMIPDFPPDPPTQESEQIGAPPKMPTAPDINHTVPARVNIDHSQDFKLVFLGSLISVIGLLLMIGLGRGNVFYSIASAVALFGLSFSSFVVLSCGFGSHRANVIGALAGALLFSGSFGVGVEAMFNHSTASTQVIQKSIPPVPAEVPVPTPKEKPVEVVNTDAQPEQVVVPAKQEVQKPVATSKTKKRKKREKTAGEEGKKTEKSVTPAEPTPEPNPDPEKATASQTAEEPAEEQPASTAKSLPKHVITQRLNSNRRIMSCFLKERSNNGGNVPDRVKVQLTIRSSGSVSKMYVTSGKYVGSAFEVCLRSAITRIQFPPFEGDSQTISHTLRSQR